MPYTKEIEWEIPEGDNPLSGEVIETKYWKLPIESLGEWRPRTAYIDYRYFLGPQLKKREHGLSLNQDLVAALHGPRGATKTMTLSFLQGKKMRMGQPDWANYPISFYVIEAECLDNCKTRIIHPWKCGAGCPFGCFTYYENMPLDLDKFYRFSKMLRNGNVGITEFQYYVESRTSGKKQNRLATYQIMQIRKTALSFWYDVQNADWVDKRFAWSDDTVINVQDVAMMRYDYASIGHFLERGERSLWNLEDRSGVLSGQPHSNYGPFEFQGWPFRNIYPTHWIVDAYEAMNSLHEEEQIKAGREDKMSKELSALNVGLNSFVETNQLEFTPGELSKRVEELTHIKIAATKVGHLLHDNGLEPTVIKHKNYYNISALVESGEGSLTGKDDSE